MKFDKELVREILLQLEEFPEPLGYAPISVEGFSVLQVSYHIRILFEAGYLIAEDMEVSHFEWRAVRLTYKGHEFIDTLRNSKVWKLTKESATTVGAGGLKLLLEIGRSVLKQELGKHGLPMQ